VTGIKGQEADLGDMADDSEAASKRPRSTSTPPASERLTIEISIYTDVA